MSLVILFYIGTNSKIKRAQSVDMIKFEQLVQELKADNQYLMAELAAMKETLNSINNMMKDI